MKKFTIFKRYPFRYSYQEMRTAYDVYQEHLALGGAKYTGVKLAGQAIGKPPLKSWIHPEDIVWLYDPYLDKVAIARVLSGEKAQAYELTALEAIWIREYVSSRPLEDETVKILRDAHGRPAIAQLNISEHARVRKGKPPTFADLHRPDLFV